MLAHIPLSYDLALGDVRLTLYGRIRQQSHVNTKEILWKS